VKSDGEEYTANEGLKRNYVLMDMHCTKNWIYVFPEKELRGLYPNFHFHVSVGGI